MTSYFDEASHAVGEIPRDLPNESFLEAIAAIEKPIIECVSLNTGDREFPDDLREKIQSVIAVWAIYQRSPELKPTERAVDWALTMRSSELVEVLHSAFHALAGRRIKTRFGYWTDSPRANLVSRDDHDAAPKSPCDVCGANPRTHACDEEACEPKS